MVVIEAIGTVANILCLYITFYIYPFTFVLVLTESPLKVAIILVLSRSVDVLFHVLEQALKYQGSNLMSQEKFSMWYCSMRFSHHLILLTMRPFG